MRSTNGSESLKITLEVLLRDVNLDISLSSFDIELG